eukprot:719209_1
MAEQKQQTFNIHQRPNSNGFIEWKVTGDLLQQFKDAKHHNLQPLMELFKHEILFYPRGDTSPDYCSIYLQCVKMSGNKTQIGVNFSLDIAEVDWVHDAGETFKKDGQTWGRLKAFKAERINNLYAMNLKCFVEETMDVSDANTYFEWKVNNY